MDSRNIEKYDCESANHIDTLLRKHCLHIRKGFLLVGPQKFFLSSGYERFAEQINNFEVDSNDTWVTGYPKSGTNWLQEIVWCIKNNLDFEKARSKTLNERFPSLEISILFDISEELKAMTEKLHLLNHKFIENSLEYSKNLECPRFIKTHLPYSLLPKDIYTKKPKIIYIARNPKDIVPSYHNHLKIFEMFDGTLSDVAELFMNDRLQFAPYFKHVEEYWKAAKTSDNILFIRFEDMKLNTIQTIQTIAKFLGCKLNGNEIKQLMDHTSLESMKKNPALNRKFITGNDEKSEFIRSGKVGGYKEELSEEMIQRLDEWIQKSIAGTELEFLSYS